MVQVLLINDTRMVGHHGSTAVVETVLAQFAARGIEAVSHRAEPHGIEKAAETYGALVINGEGAMHRGKGNSQAFSKLAEEMKARGVPIFLINTVYQETTPEIVARMPSFTGIYCRENRSVELLASQGMAATLCPDLTFAMEMPDGLKWRPGDRILVLDSTVAGANRQLLRFANAHGLPFQTMRYAPSLEGIRSWKASRRRLRLNAMTALGYLFPRSYKFGRYRNAVADRTALLHRLTDGTRLILSGRFHGICLCMKLGVPFLALSSNTHKVEGLLSDAGLEHRMVPLDSLNLAKLESHAEWTAADAENCARYVSDAQGQIAAMFDQIAETARQSAQARELTAVDE